MKNTIPELMNINSESAPIMCKEKKLVPKGDLIIFIIN